MRCKNFHRPRSFTGQGGVSGRVLSSTLRITLFCTINCMRWVARVGNVLRCCTACQVALVDCSQPQPFPENIRRRHRILNRQIDSYATDRRHGVRGISDA